MPEDGLPDWERPVMILGCLDGIETGVRQLIRQRPLETMRARHAGRELTVPTLAETLRIKGALVLKHAVLPEKNTCSPQMQA